MLPTAARDPRIRFHRNPQNLGLVPLEANPDAAPCGTGVSIVDEDGIEYDQWTPPGDLRLPEPHQRLRRLLWTLGRYSHEMFGLLRVGPRTPPHGG